MPEQDESYGVLKGLTVVWACNIIHLFANVLLVMSVIGIFSIRYFSFAQLAYVVPFAIYGAKTKRTQFLKGVIIAGSVTFLLGTACFFSF